MSMNATFVASPQFFFTSESVTEGHPDKLCDQISDAVLDAIIGEDPDARVACECCVTTGLVMVMGEITTSTYVDLNSLVRDVVLDIGYTRAKFGFDGETCGVLTSIKEQSSDIALGVDKALEAKRGEMTDEQIEAIGAGDRLAASEIDKMRAAVSRCWNASAIIGAPEPEKLIVELDIDLNRDGTLTGAPRVVNALQINLSGNRFWKVAEQNAVRAVQACQPYDFFDPSRYNEWKAFTLNFDPSIMAGF